MKNDLFVVWKAIHTALSVYRPHPDGEFIVSVSQNQVLNEGSVIVWRLSTDELMHHFKGIVRAHFHACMTPDGKYILSGLTYKDPHLNILMNDLTSGELVREFKGHKASIISVVVSPDGRYVVSSSEDLYIFVWDISSGDLIRRINVHKHNYVMWCVSVCLVMGKKSLEH